LGRHEGNNVKMSKMYKEQESELIIQGIGCPRKP
jgi:hypothetical protein